jgi:hypothetical protein
MDEWEAVLNIPDFGLQCACHPRRKPSHPATLRFHDSQAAPTRVIGDKAYDSDRLDQLLGAEGIEMIASNRPPFPNSGWSSPTPLQTELDCRTHHRLASKLPPPLPLCHRGYRVRGEQIP